MCLLSTFGTVSAPGLPVRLPLRETAVKQEDAGGELTEVLSNIVPGHIDASAVQLVLSVQEGSLHHSGSCGLVSNRTAEAVYSCNYRATAIAVLDLPFQPWPFGLFVVLAAAPLRLFRFPLDLLTLRRRSGRIASRAILAG